MQTNISGNYNTKDKEIKIVEDYLKSNNIPYIDIRKYDEFDAGDVIVTFPNKYYSLFEVKEERYNRVMNYHQLGIDLISRLVYKQGAPRPTGIFKPEHFTNFLRTLDVDSPYFKWGKIVYSYADAHLFFCLKNDGSYEFLKVYSMKKMIANNFFGMLSKCQFAINNKSIDQMSYNDKFGSAVVFFDIELMDRLFLATDMIDIVHNVYAYNTTELSKSSIYEMLLK